MSDPSPPGGLAARLRRDLGTVGAYAALVGILVGAGIFKVTGDAFAATGPSVILGYLVLAPVILATALPYAAFASTPLGNSPGGDYAHLRHTLGPGIAFVGAWLKLISYLGAGAYLAGALADYLLELLAVAAVIDGTADQLLLGQFLATAAIVLFFAVHASGVRWFGRMQAVMCALLGLSIAVLVVPGLFAIEWTNYQPFFTGGVAGFAESLPLLFFAYAGFEALAHSGGEVQHSSDRLPRVFVRGILLTMVVFVSMSVVAFGVVPGSSMAGSAAPMAEVANRFLPAGGAAFVTFGAILAVATSLNGTMLVPARLCLVLADDGLLPRWLGAVSQRTASPVVGLGLTAAIMTALLLSGQNAFALNIAVFALMLLYCLHSVAMVLLPRRNPGLRAQIRLPLPWKVLSAAALVSAVFLAALLVDQVVRDVGAMAHSTFVERASAQTLTSLELFLPWCALGVALYLASRRRQG